MSTDYDLTKITMGLLDTLKSPEPREAVPASTSATLQAPCQMLGIERSYGWYYNQTSQKQEFYPGVTLEVDNSTLVKPIMKGQVAGISGQGNNRTVLIKHENELFSLYGGLKEVLVEEKQKVDINKTLGKTGKSFYIEIRNQDGPLNTQSIFAQ
jgi:murein DD-endopeptidase MepM/ murein hydrolase activator NlpD